MPELLEPSPPASETESGGLRRSLNLLDASLLVIGSVIGSGIFLTPSHIARAVGSTEGFYLVWIVGGVLSLCGALSYAELGAAFPRAGGIYVFLREAYGPLLGFLYGWCNFFVMQTGSIATLSAAFSIYLGYLIPLSPALAKGCSAAMILALTALNCLGLKPGTIVQNILTTIKIGSLLGVALVLFLADPTSPAPGAAAPPAAPFSLSAFGIAMIAVLWSYEGWHQLTFTAGEVKNPQRNLTGGLIIGTASIIVLYLTVNVAYLNILSFSEVAHSERVASEAMARALGPLGGTLISLAILISVTGATNPTVLGGPRVYYAMAREKLFFAKLAEVHPRFRVPVAAIVVQGLWATTLSLMGNFEQLFGYVIFMAWIFYGLGGAAVLILRKSQPRLPRPYKVLGYPFVPLLFVLMAAGLVLNTVLNDFRQAFWGLAVLLTGIPAYLYWQRKAARQAPSQ
ncbi:MAG: amino acid permease [Acidobacteriota bacterium]